MVVEAYHKPEGIKAPEMAEQGRRISLADFLSLSQSGLQSAEGDVGFSTPSSLHLGKCVYKHPKYCFLCLFQVEKCHYVAVSQIFYIKLFFAITK